MLLRSSHREAKSTHTLLIRHCSTSTIATELENAHVTNLEKVTTTFYHTEPSRLPLEINTVKKSRTTLDIYGESIDDQEGNLAKKIKAVKRSII